MEYSRLIPPGGSGTIQIKANTTGYGGKTLKKSIRVNSNDPERSQLNLKIEGKVIPFADISKDRVRFKGEAGEDLSETITIRVLPNNPFSILDAEALQGKDISFKFEKNDKSKLWDEYTLLVINKKTTPGRYYDRITLKTDSEVRPELNITVYGHILDSSKTDSATTGEKTAP